jgi:hypothetical protein
MVATVSLRKLAFCAAVLALPVAGSGCAVALVGAAAGGTGYVYAKGQQEERFHAPVPRVHKAAIGALAELGLAASTDRGDQLTANIESEFADGAHVWIEIKEVEQGESKVEVRVGLTGDVDRAKRILAGIRGRL